ncbi:MAG: putative RND superfamily exporter protein, partial [bacterium]
FGWISLVSAVFVLLVLSVGLGSLRAAVVVFPPILIACIVELALFTNLVGPLNNYTTFGTAILLGLGIDIAVHLVASVREQLASADLNTAIRRAWRVTGPACVTGALTSAAGFLTLTVSSFRGFSQLGMHLALGLVLCLLTMFVLLPLLLPFAGLTARTAPAPRQALPSASGRTRGALVLLLVATVGVATYGGTHLAVEYDFTAVARDGRVFSRMNAADQALMRETYPPIVVPVDDSEPVHVAAERIRTATREIDAVTRVLSSNDLVPYDQASRIAALTALQQRLSHPNARYLPAGLVQQLATLRTWNGEPRTRDDIPSGLYALFGADDFVLIRATGDLYDIRNSGALGKQLHAFEPRASSELLLQARLYELIFDDLPWIAVLALIAVLILVFADMRRLRWTLAIGLSLVMGLAWASAAVALADIRLNIANLVALPVLLGIGVDAVVHLAHRLQADPQTWRATRTIAVAIAISTVTTLVSFSSLLIANSGGIRSFGRLVVVGLTAVVLASCTALALFHAVWGGTPPAEVSEEPAS